MDSKTSSSTASRSAESKLRTTRRAEEEQEAKRRARGSGSSRRREDDAEAKNRARGSGSSTGDRRPGRRSAEDEEAKRRAKGSGSSQAAKPGASAADNDSSDRVSRKNDRNKARNRHEDSDREAKRRGKEGRTSNPSTNTRKGRDREAKRRAREGLGPAPAAAPANVDAADGAVALEAMAVEDAEDERVTKLEEANKKLQERMEDMARIQRGEAPIHGHTGLTVAPGNATKGTEEEEVMEEEGPPANRKRMICCIILALLVLGGAGAGAAIALGGKPSDPAPAPAGTIGTTPPANDATDPPKITGLPSASPSGSPTEGFLYPPPTPEDCLAMANREAVSGQDSMLAKNFTVDFETVLESGGDPATLESRLEESMQSKFVPLLADCQNIQRRKLTSEPFFVGNGYIDVSCLLDDGVCEAVGTCYNCLMTIEVWLKDSGIKNLPVITKIGTVLASDDLLAELELGGLIRELNVGQISQRDPTTAPSTAPSNLPSTKPSMVPSLRPSVAPSEALITTAPSLPPSCVGLETYFEVVGYAWDTKVHDGSAYDLACVDLPAIAMVVDPDSPNSNCYSCVGFMWDSVHSVSDFCSPTGDVFSFNVDAQLGQTVYYGYSSYSAEVTVSSNPSFCPMMNLD